MKTLHRKARSTTSPGNTYGCVGNASAGFRFKRFYTHVTFRPPGFKADVGECKVNNSGKVGENSWRGIRQAALEKAALNPFPNCHGALRSKTNLA